MKDKFIAAILFAGLSLGAAPLNENFSDSNAVWTLGRAAERKQSLAIEPYNDSMGKVARITFTPSVFHYLEFSPAVPVQIAETESGFKGVLSLKVCSVTPESLVSVSVRIRDASGETFQLMSHVKLRQGEWTTIAFPLSKDTKFGPPWGGNDNKKLDYPAAFQAITMDFDKGFSGQGEVFVDSIKWDITK